jgi:Transglycosylase SLT domain
MTTANALRPLATPDPELVRGIRQASAASGVDFGYLMAQAAQESGFRTDAKAQSSSATGLYQFVEGTWLDLVRRHGAKHGLSADASRADLLALREAPQLSAAMAAEYARENKAALETSLGRKAGRGELALAHFLGAGGATQFLKGLERNADAKAAELLPEAAAANRPVFYDRNGAARSIGEIWRDFSQRIEREAAAWASPAPAPAAVALAATVPAGTSPATFRASLDAPRLSRPTLAMLDALAFAALKLIGQEHRS